MGADCSSVRCASGVAHRDFGVAVHSLLEQLKDVAAAAGRTANEVATEACAAALSRVRRETRSRAPRALSPSRFFSLSRSLDLATARHALAPSLTLRPAACYPRRWTPFRWRRLRRRPQPRACVCVGGKRSAAAARAPPGGRCCPALRGAARRAARARAAVGPRVAPRAGGDPARRRGAFDGADARWRKHGASGRR